ncbi:hypothetical protein ASG66_19940 [Bacillus sp. Leaf406]|nr:hypothetical protein ASG66_19940 [Bacillus sp. Leaf406]
MKRRTSPIKSTKWNEAKGARLLRKGGQVRPCRQRRNGLPHAPRKCKTLKHGHIKKKLVVDQIQIKSSLRRNEIVLITLKKSQSEMKRRELDSCGKAGR